MSKWFVSHDAGIKAMLGIGSSAAGMTIVMLALRLMITAASEPGNDPFDGGLSVFWWAGVTPFAALACVFYGAAAVMWIRGE